MFKLATLLLLLFVLGCETAEMQQQRQEQRAAALEKARAEEEKDEAERRAKYDKLKTSKILNVRVNQDSLDFVLDSGEIVTIYAYAVNIGNNVYQGRIGVK